MTLVAAVVPAIRATRVPPVVALNVDPWAGGAVLLFVGVALVARYIVRPLAGAIGRPPALGFHERGRLARENAMRNPGRTRDDVRGLMVGLGLVVFVAVFAAGLKTSITGSLDQLVRADIVVTAKGFQPLPPNAQLVIRDVPGVDSAAGQYLDQVQVNGKASSQLMDALDGIEPRLLRSVYRPRWLHGGSDALLARPGDGDNAPIEERFAESHGLHVGDRFRIQTPSGGRATLTAIGEYPDPQILQGVTVSLPVFQRVSAMHDPFGYFVTVAPRWNRAQVQQSIAASLKRFPTAEVRSNRQYRELLKPGARLPVAEHVTAADY